jgi:hypothetical protein
MADERDKEVDVEEGGEVQPEGLVDEDEDLIAHPEWKWIAREPRRMASEIASTSLNVFTLVEGDPAPGHFGVYNVGPHQKISCARTLCVQGARVKASLLPVSDRDFQIP